MIEETPYERFKVVGSTGYVRYYAFCEIPTHMMDTLIPEGAKWGSKPTGEVIEGDEAVTEQKTLREFTFPHMTTDLGETTIILLAAMYAPAWRQHGVTPADLADWDGFMGEHGYPEDKWLTLDERNLRLPTTEL
jgi:hypothetical protein